MTTTKTSLPTATMDDMIYGMLDADKSVKTYSDEFIHNGWFTPIDDVWKWIPLDENLIK